MVNQRTNGATPFQDTWAFDKLPDLVREDSLSPNAWVTIDYQQVIVCWNMRLWKLPEIGCTGSNKKRGAGLTRGAEEVVL